MSAFNFAVILIALYLFWALTIRRGMKRLACRRSFSRTRVFEGETGELVEVVRNDTPYVIPWFRVESRISPHIRLGKQDNLDVDGEMYYCSIFSLLPYQQIRRRHTVSFLHRGAYDLGNAALTSGDVLGIFRFMSGQEGSAPVLVYPRLLDREELPLPVSRTLGELVRRQQLLTDPFLVRGIRAYQPGDPVRDIHWAATARTGEVQLRVRDYSARSRLLVLLNVQHQDIQMNNYVPESHWNWVEQAIRVAASVCVEALRSGMSAGFGCNMPMGKSDESTLILPADGTAQEEELLAAFAKLSIRRTERFPELLEEIKKFQDLDILVISRYSSDTIHQSLDMLRRNGNQVTFYEMEGGCP